MPTYRFDWTSSSKRKLFDGLSINSKPFGAIVRHPRLEYLRFLLVYVNIFLLAAEVTIVIDWVGFLGCSKIIKISIIQYIQEVDALFQNTVLSCNWIPLWVSFCHTIISVVSYLHCSRSKAISSSTSLDMIVIWRWGIGKIFQVQAALCWTNFVSIRLPIHRLESIK